MTNRLGVCPNGPQALRDSPPCATSQTRLPPGRLRYAAVDSRSARIGCGVSAAAWSHAGKPSDRESAAVALDFAYLSGGHLSCHCCMLTAHRALHLSGGLPGNPGIRGAQGGSNDTGKAQVATGPPDALAAVDLVDHRGLFFGDSHSR